MKVAMTALGLVGIIVPMLILIGALWSGANGESSRASAILALRSLLTRSSDRPYL